ncbi:hypothetical protein GHH_c32590 [Geobacillus sp. GHH01]|nr:hypothetical protein GHH_c32590 [Geobacillus sp. GHH01]
MSYSWEWLIFSIFLSAFMLYIIIETSVRRAIDSSTLARTHQKTVGR